MKRARMIKMRRERILFSLLFILLASISVSVSVSSASASVSYFEISPENPVKGDVVKIVGKASPSEEVPIQLSFEKDLSVVDGEYKWKLSSVEIPVGENRFTVTATNVEDLNVALRIFIWFTKSADADNGIARISQSNVPAGTHDAKISGKSNSDEVSIRVEAGTSLEADGTGHFEYRYDTSSIPAGEFVVTVGSITKTVKLLETGSTPTPDGSGGSGGSYATTTPTPTPTTTENVTTINNETVISTTPTPTPTSSPTTSPIVTPSSTSPTLSPLITSSPGASPLPISSQHWIPGFEAVFAISGLFAVAYLIRRKKT